MKGKSFVVQQMSLLAGRLSSHEFMILYATVGLLLLLILVPLDVKKIGTCGIIDVEYLDTKSVYLCAYAGKLY